MIRANTCHIEHCKTAIPLSNNKRARYKGLRENLKEPSRTILTVGFAGLNGVLLSISALKALIAVKHETTIRKQPEAIRNVHAQPTSRNGNKYSRKTPAPKHVKKISGGGILTAALSFEFISMLILI
jgi:hypothetical protein